MRQQPPTKLRPNCLLTRYPICFVHGLKSIFHFTDYWYGVPEYLWAHGYATYQLSANWRGPNEVRLDQWSKQFQNLLKQSEKLHVIAHSLGCLNMLELLNRSEFDLKFKSVTFVSPPFGGSHWAQLGEVSGLKFFPTAKFTADTLTPQAAHRIVSSFIPPKDVLLCAVLSSPGKFPISPKLSIQHRLLTRYLKKKNLSAENDALLTLESQRIALKFCRHFLEFPGDHNQVVGAGPWPVGEKTAHEMFLDHCIFLAENDLLTSQ